TLGHAERTAHLVRGVLPVRLRARGGRVRRRGGPGLAAGRHWLGDHAGHDAGDAALLCDRLLQRQRACHDDHVLCAVQRTGRYAGADVPRRSRRVGTAGITRLAPRRRRGRRGHRGEDLHQVAAANRSAGEDPRRAALGVSTSVERSEGAAWTASSVRDTGRRLACTDWRFTMDSSALRERQAPLKSSYTDDPEAAKVTLSAEG